MNVSAPPTRNNSGVAMLLDLVELASDLALPDPR